MKNDRPTIESMPHGFVFSEDGKILERCPRDYKGTVNVPKGAKIIGKSSLCKMKGLQGITLPDTLTRIQTSAFTNCENLQSVALPPYVTEIGAYAFSGCRAMSALSLPEGLLTIGNGAFVECSGLDELTIPSTVINMGNKNPFASSTPIGTVVTYPKKGFRLASLSPLFSVMNGCLVDMERKTLMAYIGSGDSCVIPSGIETIGELAFACNPYIKEVIIPESVTTIKNSAFWRCASLQHIDLPESIQNLGHSVFGGCCKLRGVLIPKPIRTITDSMFIHCGELSEVRLPETLTAIESNAFGMCQSLNKITIPQSVASVGNNPFFGCGKVAVKSNSPYFVMFEDYLIDEKNMALIAYVGDQASVEIPAVVQQIGESAFENAQCLVRVVIPSSVDTIGHCAFENCRNLQEIDIPDSVDWIGHDAFMKCVSLLEIRLPDRLKQIDFSVFDGCRSLKAIKYHNCTYSIEIFEIMESELPVNNPLDLLRECEAYLAKCSELEENEYEDLPMVSTCSKSTTEEEQEVLQQADEEHRKRRLVNIMYEIIRDGIRKKYSYSICYNSSIQTLESKLRELKNRLPKHMGSEMGKGNGNETDNDKSER